jgi:hypothetical protein
MDGRSTLDAYISCAVPWLAAGSDQVGAQFAGHSDSVRSGFRNHSAAAVYDSEFCNGPYKQPTNIPLGGPLPKMSPPITIRWAFAQVMCFKVSPLDPSLLVLSPTSM